MTKKVIKLGYGAVDYRGNFHTFYLNRLDNYISNENIDHIIFINHRHRGLSIIKENGVFNIAILKFWGTQASQFKVDFDSELAKGFITLKTKKQVLQLVKDLYAIDLPNHKTVMGILNFLRETPKKSKVSEREEFYRGV